MPTTALAPKRAVRAARTYLKDLWSRREFAWYLAMGNLKARNASTTLGLFWWVLNPLLLGAVYFTVFGLIFDRGDLDESDLGFLPYLLSGMFPFYYTQSSMTGGVNSIVSNTKLLANLHFPRLILPISALIESFVGFMASILVLYAVVGPTEGVWPSSTIVWLIPTVIIHTIFNFGLATLVARIAVPFRDLNNLVPYFTRLWLYLSPILYTPALLENAPDSVRQMANLNPLAPILALYRYSLVGMETDLAASLLSASAWALAIGFVGALSFVRQEGRMARYL
jgi:teichoic acid transport system permease protein